MGAPCVWTRILSEVMLSVYSVHGRQGEVGPVFCAASRGMGKAAFLFVLLLAPETKGRTLKQSKNSSSTGRRWSREKQNMGLSRRNLLKLGAGAAAAVDRRRAALDVAADPAKEKDPHRPATLLGARRSPPRTCRARSRPWPRWATRAWSSPATTDARPKTSARCSTSNGLKCCGTHTALDTLTGDALKRTVEFNKTLGNKFLIVPIAAAGQHGLAGRADRHRQAADRSGRAR